MEKRKTEVCFRLQPAVLIEGKSSIAALYIAQSELSVAIFQASLAVRQYPYLSFLG